MEMKRLDSGKLRTLGYNPALHLAPVQSLA